MKKLIIKLLVVAMFCTILPTNLVVAEKSQGEQQPQVSSKAENKVERKEVIDKRTEKMKTFQNINGTTTTEIHQSPIHYKDPISKKWKDIDNTLLKKSNINGYTNSSNVFQVNFTDTMASGKTVMELTEKEFSISLRPLNSNGKRPKATSAVAKENKVTYKDAYENTDLSYTVGSEKVKEDIILKEKPTAEENIVYTFAIDLKGLTHEVQKDGRILLKEKNSGDPIYYLEKPFMFDSSKPEGFKGFSENAVPEEALSYEVEMKTEKKGNQLLISIIPNKDWLLDDSRTYPVTIDPTIAKYQPVTELVDTNIRSALPTQTGGADLELGAGLYKNSTTNNVIRTLLKFDVSDIPDGVRVIDSQLNLWASSVWNDTSVRLDLHPATSVWDENAATWNKRTASASWSRSGGDYGSSHFSSQTVGALGSTLASNHYKWSVSPTYLEKTINSSSLNLGFLLKSNSEATAAYKKFYSGDNLEYAGYSPLLSVTYVTNSRLGLEDYWTYDEQELTDGSAYVNLGTGNGVFQFSDFEISSRGNSGISFERTYNTKASETNSFGPGWSFTGSESITEQTSDKNITYTERDGTVHVFLYNNASNSYTTPAGIYLTLNKDGIDGYKLKDQYGNISRFKKVTQDNETSGYTVAKLEYEEDRNGNKTSYVYNTKGNVTSITDASGKTMTISYGFSGISSIVFSGKKYTYHYTFEGQLKEVRNYKDSTSYVSTFFEYDSNGKLEKIIDANKTITKIVYQNGFVHQIQQPSTSGLALPVTSYSYNISNYVSTVMDPEGGITQYQMNENYVILSVTDPLGETFKNDVLDANYNPTQLTDGEDNITYYLYDSKGNLLEETDPKGNKNTFTYDQYSNIKTEADAKGTTIYSYDSKGNLIKVKDPLGNITEYNYDLYGNKISTIFPNGYHEDYAYDSLNNFINTTRDPLGRTTTSLTDNFGNVTSLKDPKGNTTFYSYDQRQLLKDVKNAQGATSSYAYDNNGNMTSVTNASNKVISMTYNEKNQLLSRQEPMGEVTFMEYDDNSNLITIKKSLNENKSNIIQNQYDSANQLKSILVDGLKKWSYQHDGNGNVNKVTDELTHQVKVMEYDVNNNLEKVIRDNQYITYGYNDTNELSSINFKSNTQVKEQSYRMDLNGHLTKILLNGAEEVDLKYTKNGLSDVVFYGNGITAKSQYDQAEQLETYSVNHALKNMVTEKFNYDMNGNIVEIKSSLGDRSYTYDELNQLKSQTLQNGSTELYDYDSNGNRVKKTIINNGKEETFVYVHNANNQLTSVNGHEYIYNKSGNRIKDDRFIYEYNAFDELTALKDHLGNNLASYTYDESGKRTSKTIDGETINYHYGQGINVLFETDDKGNVITEYSYDQSGFPLTMTKNEQTFYYTLNGNKDVVAITDKLGNIVASYSYDDWGNILSQTGALAEENPYRYKGYRYDNESQHYYLIARYYHPVDGVFLTSDPLGGHITNPLTQNGYSYANNNPVMMMDPDGEYAWIIKEIAKYALKTAIKNPNNIRAISSNISSFLRKSYVKKALKKSGYSVQTNLKKGYILKVMHKNKRMLSIDFHGLSVFYKKGVNTQAYQIFHLHLGGSETHYIPRSMIPKGFKIKSSALNNKRYVWISEHLF